MSPELAQPYLQYGALGILSFVLLGVGYWLTWYAKEQQAVIRGMMDRFEDRMRLQDEFIRAQMEDWKEMVKSCADAQVSMAAAFSQVAREVESNSARHKEGVMVLQQEHAQIMTVVK